MRLIFPPTPRNNLPLPVSGLGGSVVLSAEWRLGANVLKVRPACCFLLAAARQQALPALHSKHGLVALCICACRQLSVIPKQHPAFCPACNRYQDGNLH